MRGDLGKKGKTKRLDRGQAKEMTPLTALKGKATYLHQTKSGRQNDTERVEQGQIKFGGTNSAFTKGGGEPARQKKGEGTQDEKKKKQGERKKRRLKRGWGARRWPVIQNGLQMF